MYIYTYILTWVDTTILPISAVTQIYVPVYTLWCIFVPIATYSNNKNRHNLQTLNRFGWAKIRLEFEIVDGKCHNKVLMEDSDGILIELSMRQQFAGPLGSGGAMQMLALHFTLGPTAVLRWSRERRGRCACMPDVPLSSQEIESAA